MKITITYKNDGDDHLACFATTVLPGGKNFVECAHTYEEARKGLLTKVARFRKVVLPPPPEEIELDDGPNQ